MKKIMLIIVLTVFSVQNIIGQEVQIKSISSCVKTKLLTTTNFQMKIELQDTLGFDSIYFELRDDNKVQVVVPAGMKYGGLSTEFYPLASLSKSLSIGLEVGSDSQSESVNNISVYTISKNKIVSSKATCQIDPNSVDTYEKKKINLSTKSGEVK